MPHWASQAAPNGSTLDPKRQAHTLWGPGGTQTLTSSNSDNLSAVKINLFRSPDYTPNLEHPREADIDGG